MRVRVWIGKPVRSTAVVATTLVQQPKPAPKELVPAPPVLPIARENALIYKPTIFIVALVAKPVLSDNGVSKDNVLRPVNPEKPIVQICVVTCVPIAIIAVVAAIHAFLVMSVATQPVSTPKPIANIADNATISVQQVTNATTGSVPAQPATKSVLEPVSIYKPTNNIVEAAAMLATPQRRVFLESVSRFGL